MAINGGNDVKLCQEALNELTDLVQNSKKAFFTADNAIVNRQAMMEIIDRIDRRIEGFGQMICEKRSTAEALEEMRRRMDGSGGNEEE